MNNDVASVHAVTKAQVSAVAEESDEIHRQSDRIANDMVSCVAVSRANGLHDHLPSTGCAPNWHISRTCSYAER